MQNSPQTATTPRFPRLGLPQIWVRFLLAIAGLTLAFGAALFSTILGESGNLWGTIILARRTDYGALPGSASRRQPCPRSDGL